MAIRDCRIIMEDIFSKENKKEAEKLEITADIHEKNSLVISELVAHSIKVNFESLEVADFLVRDIAIERKTISDFLSSMVSKRLVDQLIGMKQYENPLLIIEGMGEKSLYSSGINENAIRGFLLSISLELKVPIIFTKDYEDTAKFLVVLARKKENPNISLRAKRRAISTEEQKQFILEGFPGIGPGTAKKLLENFKTIKSIINADKEDLKKVIKSKAENFKKIIEE